MKKLIFVILLTCAASFAVNAQGTGQGAGQGTGSGSGNIEDNKSNSNKAAPNKKNVKNKRLEITSKPAATFTEIARSNNVQGTVRLKVEFLKNKKIGKIEIVSALPDGLTEQAREAAKKIRFNPELRNGKPVTTTRIIEYTFTLY